MTPEQRRRQLMKELYEVYMKAPWVAGSWNSRTEGEDFKEIYREAEWLHDHGFIRCNLTHTGVDAAKITTRGRDAYEAGEFADPPDAGEMFR